MFDQLIFSRRNTGTWPDLKDTLAAIKRLVQERAKPSGPETNQGYNVKVPVFQKEWKFPSIKGNVNHRTPVKPIKQILRSRNSILSTYQTEASCEFDEMSVSNLKVPFMPLEATGSKFIAKLRLSPLKKKSKAVLVVPKTQDRYAQTLPTDRASQERLAAANLMQAICPSSVTGHEEKSHERRVLSVDSKPLERRATTDQVSKMKSRQRDLRKLVDPLIHLAKKIENSNTIADILAPTAKQQNAFVKIQETAEQDRIPARRLKTEEIKYRNHSAVVEKTNVGESGIFEGWGGDTSSRGSFIEDLDFFNAKKDSIDFGDQETNIFTKNDEEDNFNSACTEATRETAIFGEGMKPTAFNRLLLNGRKYTPDKRKKSANRYANVSSPLDYESETRLQRKKSCTNIVPRKTTAKPRYRIKDVTVEKATIRNDEPMKKVSKFIEAEALKFSSSDEDLNTYLDKNILESKEELENQEMGYKEFECNGNFRRL